MFINIPPAFTTGLPHMGHLLYLTKVDSIHRAKLKHNIPSKLALGYDCHGIPTKIKVGELKRRLIEPSQQDLKLSSRFTVEAIKEFEKLVNLLNVDIAYRWTTADLFYQIKVDKFLELANKKGLLYFKYNIQQYCPYCNEYLAHSELGTIYEEKLNYEVTWYVENVPYVVTTTKPELIGYTCALVFKDCIENVNLRGKYAVIPCLNVRVPIILDSTDFKESGYPAYIVAFCGSISDYTFIIKHNLNFKNYIDLKENTYLEYSLEHKSIEQIKESVIKQYVQCGAIKQVDLVRGAKVLHAERTSCKMPIEYHYSLQYYVHVNKIKNELLSMVETINITPYKYKQQLLNWIKNARDWCIGRKYSWASHMHIKQCSNDGISLLDGIADLIHFKDVYYDVWVDSSVSWLYTADILNCKEPAELQIQGYEILTSWAYYSMIAAVIFDMPYPFANLKLTSLLRDKTGKKYSKSSPNYEPPANKIQKYGLSTVRMWAILMDSDADQILEQSVFVYVNRVMTKLESIFKFSKLYPCTRSNNCTEPNDYDCYYKELVQIYNKYNEKLFNTYRHDLKPIIEHVYKVSNEFIQKNYDRKDEVEFRYYLFKITNLYRDIFEPIVAITF